jgi:hypothetical protein
MKLNVKLQKELHPTVCCVLELNMHQHVPSNKTNSESRHLSWQSVSPTFNCSELCGVELLLWHLICLSVCQSQSIPSQCQISLFQISAPIHCILNEVPCQFLSLSTNVLGKWTHHKQHQNRFPVNPIMTLPIIPPTDSVVKYSEHEPITMLCTRNLRRSGSDRTPQVRTLFIWLLVIVQLKLESQNLWLSLRFWALINNNSTLDL